MLFQSKVFVDTLYAMFSLHSTPKYLQYVLLKRLSGFGSLHAELTTKLDLAFPFCKHTDFPLHLWTSFPVSGLKMNSDSGPLHFDARCKTIFVLSLVLHPLRTGRKQYFKSGVVILEA